VTKKGSHLYRLLRPELVKRNAVPLSSDAFTGFQSPGRDTQVNNNEVKQATTLLVEQVIPTYANELNARYADVGPGLDEFELVAEIHRVGINIRFLGHIRRCVTVPAVRALILAGTYLIMDKISDTLMRDRSLIQCNTLLILSRFTQNLTSL
jgi:hypothetical protein